MLRLVCSFLSGYMWSQVGLRRQVNHHVYLKPVSGTDQTFAQPASPLCRSFLSVLLSTPIFSARPSERQRAVKHQTKKNSVQVSVCGWDTSSLSLAQFLCIFERPCLFHSICMTEWCWGLVLGQWTYHFLFIRLYAHEYTEICHPWYTSEPERSQSHS